LAVARIIKIQTTNTVHPSYSVTKFRSHCQRKPIHQLSSRDTRNPGGSHTETWLNPVTLVPPMNWRSQIPMKAPITNVCTGTRPKTVSQMAQRRFSPTKHEPLLLLTAASLSQKSQQREHSLPQSARESTDIATSSRPQTIRKSC